MPSMSDEIEAKIKVSDLATIRKKLEASGAVRKKKELETNTFFDAADHRLQSEDRGLRIRIAVDETGKSRCTITMKGPLRPGQFKTREEIEFSSDKPEAAREIFKHLGYQPTLSFEKRRETWLFGNCEVALDELPYLGTYVEIEGKSEEQIAAARNSLGLSSLPLISIGYISLLWRYLQEHRIGEREIRF
jgi:adenylate cyclase, class 2